MSSAESNARFLIFVIGCPGAGKGTLCGKLASEYNGCHLSVGDLLRAKTHDQDSPESSELAPYIRSGTLVPTDVLLGILEGAITQGIREKPLFFLIDGFPRLLEQGMEFEIKMGKPDLVLFVSCDKEIAKERFQTRKLPGRLDDDVELFEKRNAEFEILNEEIVAYYQAKGVLVQVDAEGETETTYHNLTQILNARAEWAGLLAGS